MLAIAKVNAAPGLEAITAPCPEPGPGELLVRVRACGLCGSDLKIHQWSEHIRGLMAAYLPVIIGHEFSGDVVALGPGLDGTGFRVGDAVCVEPIISCGDCYMCRLGKPNLCRNRRNLGVSRDGGMAEFCTVPAACAYRLPPGLSHAEGALVETLAVAAHALAQTPVADDSFVSVLGLGPVGLLLVQAIKATTTAKVIAIGTKRNRDRVELAASLGADYQLIGGESDVPRGVLDITGGRGADTVFEAAGPIDAALLALNIARPAGRVCLIGAGDEVLPVKPFSMLRSRELSVDSITGRVPSDWEQALALTASGAVDLSRLVDRRVPLADALGAFDLLLGGGGVIKVVIDI